jgi:hypothetical protein
MLFFILLGLQKTWSGIKPILTTYIEWLKEKNEEHTQRILQLDDESRPMKRRDARYVELDERIRLAKQRFVAQQILDGDDGNIVPIILSYLSYVSHLFGHNRPKEAVVPSLIDPASISLFDPVGDTIDSTITTVITNNSCPAQFHCYYPPCTHRRPEPVSIAATTFAHAAIPVLSDDFFAIRKCVCVCMCVCGWVCVCVRRVAWGGGGGAQPPSVMGRGRGRGRAGAGEGWE